MRAVRCSGSLSPAGYEHRRRPLPTRMQHARREHRDDRPLHLGASIFLPRYSGVRPTISPAMKTVRRTNMSMP